MPKSKTVGRTDLVDAVAAATGQPKTVVDQVVKQTLAAIGAALKKGNQVTLVGFGTFKVRSRKAREGRNPRTRETIAIPATKVPVFTPGKSLRHEVS